MTGRSNAWIAGLLIGLTMGLSGCHRTPDDVAVRRAVHATVAAAEAVDVSAFADQLAEDFTGNGGELDRRALVNMLRLVRLRHEAIHALLGPVTVEPRGDRYVVRFTVTLTGGGQLLPSDLGVYQVESGWRLDHGGWVCYTARWKRSI